MSKAMAEPGYYGIKEDPDGALECFACGRHWTEDITPSGRCPWEFLHND